MSKKVLAAAFVAGLVFAAGLGISGMTQPSKVIGFLDIFGGHWDPSLALVMAGAIAVHVPLYRWFRARPNAPALLESCGPIGDEQTESGAVGSTSGRLMAGAAIFGVGWGLGGYCPGPAVVSVVSAGPGTLLFVGTMLLGMLAFDLATAPRTTERSREPTPPPRRPSTELGRSS